MSTKVIKYCDSDNCDNSAEALWEEYFKNPKEAFPEWGSLTTNGDPKDLCPECAGKVSATIKSGSMTIESSPNPEVINS
jgi:hypothetical protein